MRRARLAACLCIFMVIIVAASNAAASTMLVTTESNIIDDGLLSWSALCTIHSPPCLPNPFTMNVPGIPGLTITGTGANGESRTQGVDWLGNFGNGETLLFTTTPGLFDFTFNAPIRGFGSQIEANLSGAFTARIEAFDAGNVSLGSFTEVGNSTLFAGDDSAIFIGILSGVADIRRITIDVPAFQNFAINSPRIQTGAAVTADPVPEPASMILLGTGLAGLVARRRYRLRMGAIDQR